MAKKTTDPVDQYISTFSEDVQALLMQVRETIRKTAPDAKELINYGIPTFKLHGRNLVHYAAFKAHVGFYPGVGAITEYKTQLSEYKGAKGSVQFPFDKPLPLKLIKEIVKFRLKEEDTRSRLKKSK